MTADAERVERLLAGVAQRDRAAFRELYELTAPRLLGSARQLVRRQELAEEIVQEAFVAVWERAGDYDVRLSRPLTWLTTIVRNRALDLLRRPPVEQPIEDDFWLEAVASDAPNAQEALLSNEASAAVRAALATLTPVQRQAITLAYYHGQSHSEIALHLGRPLGTVKTLVRRGLMRMRSMLDQRLPDEGEALMRAAA